MTEDLPNARRGGCASLALLVVGVVMMLGSVGASVGIMVAMAVK